MTPASLDRTTVLTWMRSMVDRLAHADRAGFHIDTIAPAGMPIEVWFDDGEMSELYCSRLAGRRSTGEPRARFFVLTGRHPLSAAPPRWDDAELDPVAFQALTEAAALKAAYPDRTWRIYDLDRHIGVQLSRGPHGLAPWDASAPLRLLINWALEPSGYHLTHAASLGSDGKGVLLVGRGGSGKSGTTLAGMAVGLQSVGDDYVALRTDGVPVARALFPLAKQDPSGLARLPTLRERAGRTELNWQGKVEFDLRDAFPAGFVDEIAIHAIVMPCVSGAATPHIETVPRARAMIELMRSNLFRYLGGRETRMARFADLIRRVPCYRLDLSGDAIRNGFAMRELIEALR